MYGLEFLHHFISVHLYAFFAPNKRHRGYSVLGKYPNRHFLTAAHRSAGNLSTFRNGVWPGGSGKHFCVKHAHAQWLLAETSPFIRPKNSRPLEVKCA